LKKLNDRFPKSSKLWLLRCQKDASSIPEALDNVAPEDSLPFWNLKIESSADCLFEAIKALYKYPKCSSLVKALINNALHGSFEPSKLIIQLEQRALNIVPLECFLFKLDEDLTSEEKRNVFELAVARFAVSVPLWKRYVEFESKFGKSNASKNVLLRGLVAAPALEEELFK